MRSVHLGAGWYLTHLTDRVILLQKECPIRRKITGRDGYVKVRGEPGMDRYQLLNKAIDIAKADDARLAMLVARDILPSNVRRHQAFQRTMATPFATPEEPEKRVYAP